MDTDRNVKPLAANKTLPSARQFHLLSARDYVMLVS